jgi:hypothetical protein
MNFVGIDAGYANLSYCVVNSDHPFEPVSWVCCRILEGKYSEEKLFKACYEWVHTEKMSAIFNSATRIVLERQMTLKFQMINHIIRTLYYNKTVERNPTTVGAFFHFPRARAEKKKAAITLVSLNAMIPAGKKKDDLADAYLLAVYELWDNCDLLKEGWKNVRTNSIPRSTHSDKRAPRKRGPASVSLSAAVAEKTGVINTKRRLIDLTGQSSDSSDQEGEKGCGAGNS